MKKKLLLTTVFALGLAGGALAGDYITFQQVQTGNGTNGMTQAAPALVTDGVATTSSAFAFGSRPIADYAKVSIRASSTNTLQNATDLSWMRCWHYGPDPMASSPSTLVWKRCPAYDMEVDAGQSGKASVLTNTLEFPVQGPLIIESPLTRYTWTGENLQQSGTLDAGVGVAIEFITPP